MNTLAHEILAVNSNFVEPWIRCPSSLPTTYHYVLIETAAGKSISLARNRGWSTTWGRLITHVLAISMRRWTTCTTIWTLNSSRSMYFLQIEWTILTYLNQGIVGKPWRWCLQLWVLATFFFWTRYGRRSNQMMKPSYQFCYRKIRTTTYTNLTFFWTLVSTASL